MAIFLPGHGPYGRVAWTRSFNDEVMWYVHQPVRAIVFRCFFEDWVVRNLVYAMDLEVSSMNYLTKIG